MDIRIHINNLQPIVIFFILSIKNVFASTVGTAPTTVQDPFPTHQIDIPAYLFNGHVFGGFASSLYCILISEIGDKTFFIAAVMSMQFSRLLVYTGAISALALMTTLSAYTMKDTSAIEEFEEVKSQLTRKSVDVEANGSIPGVSIDRISVRSRFRRLFSPVFIEAFILTFFAEWGDRSQITTMVLAATKSSTAVIFGGVFGHMICTGIAVIIGGMVSAKIPVKTLHYVGAVTFVLFAILTFLGDPNSNS